MATPRSSTVRRINRHTAATLGSIADWSWDVFRILCYIVAPVAFALFEIVAVLVREGHPFRAYLAILVTAIIGLGIAILGLPPRQPRPRRRSASVQRINRRAAWVLIPAAIGLATVLAILATRPAGLWLLACVGIWALIGWAAFEGARFIVKTFSRSAR